ncbi:MAG: nicotinate-nucleotide adenylyltransferase [Candidatus Kryptoniota bacterium]
MSEMPSEKVGIFGGTFNPPHVAHLVAAENVCDHLKLDRVLFVPAAIPPHKLNEKIISAELRLQMVKLSIRDNSKFEVCDIELRRSGPSYSIDTIVELKGKFPGDDFFFIMGIDLLTDFYSWKNPDKILNECNVVVMDRPGFALASVDKELLRRVEVVNVPSMDISSSDIRRRVKSGKSIKFLVPPAVEDYIYANSIYR